MKLESKAEIAIGAVSAPIEWRGTPVDFQDRRQAVQTRRSILKKLSVRIAKERLLSEEKKEKFFDQKERAE